MKAIFVLTMGISILLVTNTAECSDACRYDKKELMWLVETSQNEKIMEIVEDGCDLKRVIDGDDLDLLNVAVYTDNIQVVKLLLNQGVSVNRVNNFGNLSISWCISLEMAEYLVSKGININFVDKDGWTPLHDYSGRRSRLDIAKFIISRGAHINARDNIGFTPLMIALKSSPISYIQFLVKNGANVNIRTHDKTTALHLAVLRGDVDIVKTLIDADADVNAQNNGKMTPLHQAAIDGRYEIVKLLVESGADVNIRNIRGKTPLWAAENMRPYPTRVKPEEMNRKEVIEYLKQAGGI